MIISLFFFKIVNNLFDRDLFVVRTNSLLSSPNPDPILHQTMSHTRFQT